jgi:hypothetical protein
MHEQSSKGTQIKSREELRCLVLSIDHESQVRARRFARNKRTKRSPNMDHQALAHQPSPPTGGRVTVTWRTLAHVPAHMAWISADGGGQSVIQRGPQLTQRPQLNPAAAALIDWGRLIPTITPGVLHRDLFQNKKNPGAQGLAGAQSERGMFITRSNGRGKYAWNTSRAPHLSMWNFRENTPGPCLLLPSGRE